MSLEHGEYGPVTKTQALIDAMTERAHYYGITNRGGYDADDVSLLLDALDGFGMTMDDLSAKELRDLADIEGVIVGQYMDDSDSSSAPESNFDPEDPQAWVALHDRMDFRPAPPSPNEIIRRALAPEALAAAAFAEPGWILTKDEGGIIRERRQQSDGTFEERGEQ